MLNNSMKWSFEIAGIFSGKRRETNRFSSDATENTVYMDYESSQLTRLQTS